MRFLDRTAVRAALLAYALGVAVGFVALAGFPGFAPVQQEAEQQLAGKLQGWQSLTGSLLFGLWTGNAAFVVQAVFLGPVLGWLLARRGRRAAQRALLAAAGFPLLIGFLNALFLGLSLGLRSHSPAGLLRFVSLLFPHGFVELPVVILAVATGVSLALDSRTADPREMRKRIESAILSRPLWKLLACYALLLLLAAGLEAWAFAQAPAGGAALFAHLPL